MQTPSVRPRDGLRVKNESGTAVHPPLIPLGYGRRFCFLLHKGGIFLTRLGETLRAYLDRDPAAGSRAEVLLLYPGLRALFLHRIAHRLYRRGLKLPARWLSQRTRRKTGIEIHPGAKLGRRIVIDHGAGIVIGETAEVGDDCLIYHGVTLGGTGKGSGKRHPTVGKGVLLSAGAKVLGPVYIGDGARIGANAVVLTDVPAHATAAGIPARILRRDQ